MKKIMIMIMMILCSFVVYSDANIAGVTYVDTLNATGFINASAFYDDGVLLAAYTAEELYIYQDTSIFRFNTSVLNATIDARSDFDTTIDNCSVTDSCANILYETELDTFAELNAQIADAIMLNKTYSDTLYAGIAAGNSSWNETYANTLYADISVTDTTYTATGQGLDLTATAFSIVWADFVSLLGNWSNDKSDYWNASLDLDTVISDDEIAEGKIAFATACAAGNHYFLNGNDLNCEADDDTTYTAEEEHIYLDGTTFRTNITKLNATIEGYGYSTTAGTVTSVATDDSYLTGGAITTTGTITFNESVLNATIEGYGYGNVIGVTGTSPIVSSEGATPAISAIILKDIVATTPLTVNGGANLDDVLLGTDADVTFAISATPTFTTIDTGQGQSELYPMDQYVNTTSDVDFGRVKISQTLTTGYGLEVTRNLDSTDTTSPVVFIVQDNASDDQIVLKIQNDATAQTMYLDVNNNAKAITIESVATTQGMIYGSCDSAATIINLGDSRDSTATNWFYRNLASASSAAPVVFIEQDNAGDDQPALSIQQDGTGIGLDIDQNGNSRALAITSSATDAGVVQIYNNENYTGSTFASLFSLRMDNVASTGTVSRIQNDGSGIAFEIDQNGNSESIYIDSEATTTAMFFAYAANTDGNIFEIRSDGAHGDTGNSVMRLASSNANHNATMLELEQAGKGIGLHIDQNNVAPSAALYVDSGTLNTNKAIWAYSNVNADAVAPLVFFEADNAAFDEEVLQIQNDGVGVGIFIDQNGNGIALDIDSEATTGSKYALRVTADQGAVPFAAYADSSNDFFVKGTSAAANGNYFYRNVASATTAGPVMFIEQDNAGDDQNALSIQQDGTGWGLRIDHANAAAGAIVIADTYPTAGTAQSVNIDMGGNTGVRLGGGGANAGGFVHVNRDQASANTAGPVMFIEQDNAGDDQPALQIQQDIATVAAIDIVNNGRVIEYANGCYTKSNTTGIYTIC